MSQLKPFESLEDLNEWWQKSARCGRSCPLCLADAAECPHPFREMRHAIRLVRSAAAADGVRIVSETGGEKGQKLERFDLIPFDVLTALARLYGKGAAKYSDDNWRRGYSWRLSMGSLLRHFTLWARGQSYDTADGTKGGPILKDDKGRDIHMGEHHLVCVIWHCFTLVVFETHELGTDDRAPSADL